MTGRSRGSAVVCSGPFDLRIRGSSAHFVRLQDGEQLIQEPRTPHFAFGLGRPWRSPNGHLLPRRRQNPRRVPRNNVIERTDTVSTEHMRTPITQADLHNRAYLRCERAGIGCTEPGL